MKTQKYLFVFLISIIISCSEENSVENECQDSIFRGEFELLNESYLAVPYESESTLYFNDSVGKLLSVEIISISDTFMTYLREDTCELNKNELIQYRTSQEEKNVILKNDSLDFKFMIKLYANSGFGENIELSDRIAIFKYLSVESGAGTGILDIIVNQRDLENDWMDLYANKPSDEIKLLGNVYLNVYSNKNKTIYYNYELGIIGFKDQTNKLWTLNNNK